MRFDKGLCLLLLVALSLRFVRSEIPESLSLTDDPSNGFIDESCATASKCAEIALVANAGETMRNLLVILLANPVRLARAELLRLLSIQRK